MYRFFHDTREPRASSSYHESFNDTKVVVDDLGEWSQAVGCAGGVAIETTRGTGVNQTTLGHELSLTLGFGSTSESIHMFTIRFKILKESKNESHLTTFMELSYFSWLTPITNIGASALGAEMTTLLAPPFR